MSGASLPLTADYVEDPFQRLVDIVINLTAGEHFLYSDVNGMLGSRDGFNWEPAASSVPAIAMAYGDGVWIAAGFGGELWRSEDYTKTWEPVSAPDTLTDLAYIRPKHFAPDTPGVFAGLWRNDYGPSGPIYASFDLGKTWESVYTPPYGYYLFVNGFHGCGSKFFLSTDEAEEGMLTSGYAHVSSDGRSWSRIPVFPGGTDSSIFGDQITKQTHNIDFDRETETYYAVGFVQHADRPAQTTTNTVVYATSGDGLSFAGESIIKSSFSPRGGGGDFITTQGHSVGAGMGKVATLMINILPSSDFTTSRDVEATVGPGGQILFHAEDPGGSFVAQLSPIGARFGVVNAETGAGTFVCAAFDFYKVGGIWTNTGGSWSQTHTGAPFHDGYQNSRSKVGLAVGRVILASEVTPS